ncbi:MAG TPA: tetraacyldisaccharide 4'-kinase, partial [Byssovorax sp.]
LRAPVAALLACADHVVVLTSDASIEPSIPGALVVPLRIDAARHACGDVVALASLAARRVGVVVGVAHPERVLAAIARAGVCPEAVARFADHARFEPRELEALARRGVDVWLTTSRDAVKLPEAIGGAAVLALELEVDVRALLGRLLGAGAPPRLKTPARARAVGTSRTGY